MGHLIGQANRSTVLAKHHWQEAPLLLALHCNHVNFVDSTSQDPGFSPAIAGPRNVLQWQQGLQHQEPGNLLVCTSESSTTSVSSVINSSNLSGKYAPEPSTKSTPEKQILNTTLENWALAKPSSIFYLTSKWIGARIL